MATVIEVAQTTVQSRQSARKAGLRYVAETTAGIRRIRKGKSFVYLSARGRRITDEATLERIRSLAIPPAWEEVWICPRPNGHLQATGLDARRRKQYRYHPRWQETRDRQKYDKLVEFACALPKIRAQVNRDLRRRGLPREKVLAAAVRVLERTCMRIGNGEYARTNDSYGLTTLRNDHARVKGTLVRFDFCGKHGIEHALAVRDSALARIIRQCQDLPGQELFEYVDDEGKSRDVGSADVNRYLRSIAGHRFSAKDFRTWMGTVAAAWELSRCEPFTSQTAARRNINDAVAKVAELLGNTRAVCRKCYIHPAVINAYLDSTLHDRLDRGMKRHRGARGTLLPSQEAAVLDLIAKPSSTRATVRKSAVRKSA